MAAGNRGPASDVEVKENELRPVPGVQDVSQIQSDETKTGTVVEPRG
jgi:hypothetical protein